MSSLWRLPWILWFPPTSQKSTGSLIGAENDPLILDKTKSNQRGIDWHVRT